MRCHKCGRLRYVLGDLVRDEKGYTYCPICKAGEGEQDGFGGINGAPPEADFLRAIEDRDFELAGAMVQAGTNVSANADTALRWAASRGDVEAVDLLLDLGADITTHNYEALRWAFKEKHEDVVELLLARGADPAVLEEAETVGEPVRSGSTWNAEGHRWWSCPICKVHVDAEVDGRIIDADRLMCPKCGCLELDPDDGEHFLPGAEKVKPKIITGGITPELKILIKDARATLTEAGLFPMDESENEPRWPKDLAAVLLASLEALKAGVMGPQENLTLGDFAPVDDTPNEDVLLIGTIIYRRLGDQPLDPRIWEKRLDLPAIDGLVAFEYLGKQQQPMSSPAFPECPDCHTATYVVIQSSKPGWLHCVRCGKDWEK